MDCKQCSHCKKVKEIEAFARSKSNKDGRNYYCRECCSLRLKSIRGGSLRGLYEPMIKKMPKEPIRRVYEKS